MQGLVPFHLLHRNSIDILVSNVHCGIVVDSQLLRLKYVGEDTISTVTEVGAWADVETEVLYNVVRDATKSDERITQSTGTCLLWVVDELVNLL